MIVNLQSFRETDSEFIKNREIDSEFKENSGKRWWNLVKIVNSQSIRDKDSDSTDMILDTQSIGEEDSEVMVNSRKEIEKRESSRKNGEFMINARNKQLIKSYFVNK